MSAAPNTTNLQLRSLIKKSGELELSLAATAIPRPAANEVVVRVEATPINPSDVGLLFGPADMHTLAAAGTAAHPVVTAAIPQALLPGVTNRLDQSLPVGNEGAGVVVDTGGAAAARELMGRTVAVLGGAMYSQYRCVDVSQCLVLPPGTAPADGASLFVNPLTALAMVETMRHEGHKALVHTAAASSLGQMLNRLCLEDRIGLVNVVRRKDQADLLKNLGAAHVCDSEAPDFTAQLTRALIATGATLAFDAIGGGRLADQILACMEAALNADDTQYKRYGSAIHKQVYIYGGLSRAPAEIRRTYGMAWGIGGWLVFPALAKLDPALTQTLKDRVVAGMHTIFATRYGRVISLPEALHLESIELYTRAATGAKYLINPNKTA